MNGPLESYLPQFSDTLTLHAQRHRSLAPLGHGGVPGVTRVAGSRVSKARSNHETANGVLALPVRESMLEETAMEGCVTCANLPNTLDRIPEQRDVQPHLGVNRSVQLLAVPGPRDLGCRLCRRSQTGEVVGSVQQDVECGGSTYQGVSRGN